MQMLAVNQTKGFDRAELGPGFARRLPFLDEQDQKILEMTLIGRVSRREAAMIAGMSRGGLNRRITRALNRLHDPFIVALIEGDGLLLPETYREIGLAHFLRGWGTRRIACEMELSKYAVQKAIIYLKAWRLAKKEQAKTTFK